MNIKVVVECEAGSDIKNVFDEVTLESKESFQVSRAYPFPYGFIQGTKSGDGDCLDCFVLTKQPLQPKEIVEVEVVGMFEQFETRNGVRKEDHNILAVLKGDNFTVDDEVRNMLQDFIEQVWDHREGKKVEVGKFLGIEEAEALISSSRDSL